MSNYDEEKAIIEALKNKDNGSQSMRVVGRGTLVVRNCKQVIRPII